MPRAHCARRRAVQLTQSSLTTTLCEETGNTATSTLQVGKWRYRAFKLRQPGSRPTPTCLCSSRASPLPSPSQTHLGHPLCGQWATQRHSEPQSHPGWSCPSQDPGCCETAHCLPVSDSLSQDSLGLAVDFLPAAGGFRERPHPSLPASTGTGKADNTRGLEGSGWA